MMKFCVLRSVPVDFLLDFFPILSLLVVMVAKGGFSLEDSANSIVESSMGGTGVVQQAVAPFLTCDTKLHNFFQGEALRVFETPLFFQSQFVLRKLIFAAVVAVVE